MKPNLIRRLIANLDRYPVWKGRWKNMIAHKIYQTQKVTT